MIQSVLNRALLDLIDNNGLVFTYVSPIEDLNDIIWSPENITPPTIAEIEAKYSEMLAIVPFDLIREERNKLLGQTDWMAVSDRTMSAEQTAYRQALRDLPANSPNAALDENGELIGVNWPTPPST